MGLTLVVGGTRSGKSAHGERLAAATGLPVRYVATADAGDQSMRERVGRHVARRPVGWTTVEAGVGLAQACRGPGGECVLLDGLGPWIATRLHTAGAFENAARLPRAGAAVLAEVALAVRALAGARAAVVVAEQAGEGVLPPDPASRAWVDLLGDAVALVAAEADRVDLVVAGRSLTLGAAATSAGLAQAPGRFAREDLGAASLRRHGDDDLRDGDADHAVSVISGGPPSWLAGALEIALADQARRYPQEAATISALASLHGRGPDEVVPTNGAVQALWLLGPALRPRLAACVHPAFTESEAALRAHRVPVVRVLRDAERDFELDPDAVPDRADLVVVGNPASPSGTLAPSAAILALRRRGRTIVVDEAFMDLVPGQPGSLVRECLDDVIVVRSLTKALGIPGLRTGYAVAGARLADRLRAVRPPWSANVLALTALRAAAAHPAELATIAERASAEREDLYGRLCSVPGVRVWPGAANFVLVAVADGSAVVAALRAARIAVRPAASFPGLDARYIRITARGPAENSRLADRLAAAVAAHA